MTHYYLGIGSNFEREKNIAQALQWLQKHFGELRLSSIYKSSAIDGISDDYFNLAVGFESERSVGAVKDVCRDIEKELGRDRSNGSKVSIDLDILLADELCGRFDSVDLPHADIETHLHVIQPLAEIAPLAQHPQSRISLQQLLATFEQRLPVINLKPSSV